MRKSRNGQSGLFAAITKFTVLAMCFATVFALVLTAGVLDVDTSANVAEAEYNQPQSGGQVTTTAVDSGWPTVSEVHTALHDSSSGSYTFTVDLSAIEWSGVSWVSVRTSSAGESCTAVKWSPGGASGFGAKQTDGCNQTYAVVAAVNIALPDGVASFAGNSNYKVTLNSWTAARYMFWDSSSSPKDYLGVNFNASAVSADSMAQDLLNGASNGSAWQEIGTWEDGDTNEYYPSRNASGDWGFLIKDQKFTTATEMSVGDKVLALAVGRERTVDSWVIGGQTIGTAVDGIKLTFTIEYNTGENAPKDAAAPGIIEIDDTAGATTITSTLGDNLGTYLNQKSGLYGNIAGNLPEDNVTLAGNTIKMTGVAVRKGALPADWNDVSGYSKKLTLNIADYTDTGAPADDEEAWYYSGLASVAASDGSGVGVGTTSAGFSYGSPTEDSSENGLIVWDLAAPRDEATVTIYFKDNTPAEGVEFTIKDANDNAYSFNVVVDGIMEEASDISGVGITSTWETGEPLMGDSFDAVEWAYGAFEPIFTNPGNGKDALIWFFDVEYSAADPVAFGGTAPKLSQGSVTSYHPFTYSVVGSPEVDGVYNFSGENAGKFFGYPTAGGTAGKSGTGYYRFTFYAMNYAGYITETGISRYVKADIENPTNDAVVTYEYDAGEKPHAAGDITNFGTIDFDERGAYVNEPLTVTITWRENLSGNRVQIIGADGMERHVFVKDGKITQIVDLSSGQVIISAPENNECVLPTSGADMFESVKIKLTAEGENRALAVTYTLKDGNDYAEAALFTVYSNADMDTGTAAYGSIYEQSVWSDSKTWGIEGVYVYIDRYAFEADEVDLTNEGGQIERNEELDENGQLLIPAGEDRNWYTSAWEMLASLTVPTDDDRAKAYYITEYYTDAADFNAGWESIKTAQQGWSFINNAAQEGWRVYDTTQGGVAPIELKFGSDAGYYVTYVILVDGAMNKSDVAVFGVLVDANPYKLSAVYAEGYQDKLGTPYVIGFVGADGKPVTADTIFHRGDEVTFSATLGNAYTGAYVPYKLEKKDANGEILGDIYIHPYNNNSAAFTTDGIQKDYAYINIESDGTLKLDVDRNSVEKLPMLGAEGGGNYAQIVFSYRKLVDVKPTTDMTDYTGTEITPQFSVTDLTANKGSVTFGDGESPYRYTVLYHGDSVESILHAGTYTIKVTYSEKESSENESEFYVLNAEGSYPYTVNKGSIEMEVGFKEGPYTYGEVTADGVMGLIVYDIQSGLVGADKNTSFTGLFGASAKFSLPGGTEDTGYYIPAGSYEVNAVFTANDYDVTVKWTGSNELTIGKRGLTVTAAENSWTYGDALPSTYQVTVQKSAFEFDTLGLFDSAEEIAAVFGVDPSAVADGGSVWTVTVAASALRTNAAANSFGYVKAGTYDFTEFNASALKFNANFSAKLASDGNGQIKVSPVTVTVNPIGDIPNQRVESEDDIANIRIDFAANTTTQRFGISGYLTVDASSATGSGAYNVSDSAAALVSSHNSDGVTNVNINVDTLGRTVNITIQDATGTFVITFAENVQFTVSYGTFWDRNLITYDGHSYTWAYYVNGEQAEAPGNPVVACYVNGYVGGADNVLNYNVGSYSIQFTVTGFEGTEGASSLNPLDFDYEYVDSNGDPATSLTVVPAEVTVTSAKLDQGQASKVYGDLEADQLSFVFEFDGLPAGYESRFGLPEIGNIHRANADGTGAGGRYDSVGDYGVFWSGYTTDAEDSNLNITFAEGVFDPVTISITPRPIDLKGSGVTIFGTNKTYDGDSTAPDASITLDNTVILNGDNVKVIFTAADYYNGTEITGKIGSGYSVLFTGVALDGTDTGNYELILSTEGQFIYGDGFKIEPNPIVISLDHFTVGKTYDAGTGTGDTEVSIAAISELYDDDKYKFTIVSATYESADAGSVVVTVVLRFTGLPYPEKGEELANYYNLGSGVSIEKATEGVNITISGITGTIAQREITLDDIKFLFDEEGSTYRTKVYDGTASVVVPFDFEDSFKGHFAKDFDVKADAALKFAAGTVGEAKNVGKGYLIDVTNVTLDSPNYKLAEAIETDGYKAVEDKIGGTFAINARPIELGIEIEGETYDQSADAKGSAWFGAAAAGESVSITSQTYKFVRNANAGTADAASYEPFPYVQIDNFDSGHYWHDVRVTLTVTTSNFDWSNYDLQGYDIEMKEGEIVIVLEKAAYLDPVTISLTTENIKAEGKAYDGNTSATLDVSTAYETSAFLSGDADVVKLTYTAVFASPNAGTGIGITASGFKFVAKDSTKENAQFIADSYKTYTGTLTEHKGLKADITPKVLTATAKLPGKTYDGTKYGGVDEDKIVWELTGFLGSDANNYSVEVLAAGYAGADVAEDGNAKDGWVYGYKLVNNAQSGVMNYTIKAHETKEYNVYSSAKAAAPFSAELNKIIVAEYTENGAVRYLIPVESIPTAAEGTSLTQEEQALVDEIAEKLTLQEPKVPLNSFDASGKIDPAQLIFTVQIVEDSQAWKKTFDDTVNVYNAKYGASDATEGYDFKVELEDPASGGQALVGIDLTKAEFSVSFADANVGTGKDIIFTVNAGGEQSNNNNFIFNESNSYTVKGAGTITPAGADMSVGYVSGESIEATYGSAGSALLGFKYTLGSYEILVDADGYAYIAASQWNEAFGRDGTKRPALPLPTDRLYIRNDDGTFALITDETVSGDQYVRINGRFTDLNVLSADGNRLINADGLISAKAGTYENAKAHVVNANFDIVEGTSATVTVNKAELTVTTDKDAYDAVYWTGTIPAPVFTVAGNASFDDPAALAKAIKWAFKGEDGAPATVQSMPSSEGGSYKLAVEELDNYTVTIVNAAGESVPPALTITIPTLDDTVYSAVASGTRPVQLGADGNAIALDKTDLIRGVTDADEVDIKWSTTDGVELTGAPADAGSYTWTATITRKIGNYNYIGAAELNGTFEITKRNVIVSLKAGSLSFVFEEGETYKVTDSDLVAVDAETGAAVENFVKVLGIGYSKDGVAVDGMTAAGAYNLVLTIGKEFEVNYALVDRVNAIRVTPKAVTVTVADTSKSHNVTTSDADYAGIVFDSAGFENLTVTYRDGSGKVIGSTPKTPGTYTYTISSTDPNYTVSGNTTGTIRIVVSEVSFVKDGVTYATVSFTNPVATNYVLSDTTVSPNGNYWNIIDQNVAALAGENEVLSTSGIVRVALSAGGNHTSGLSEKVTVTARIPDGVAAGFDVYYVTASGKLAPLSELDPEFRIEGGNIVYTTDYVSNLIFVNSSAPGFNWWIIPLIAAALILILALAILIGVLVKLHRAPDPVPVEVAPIDSIMPEPPVVAPVAAAPAPVFEPAPAADIEPATYDAPAAVSKHGQPPIIGIR